MTQEEKQLLLKDLCARQFYGTKVLSPWEKDGPCELSAIDLTSSRQIRVFEDWFKIEEVKPYLRPMSSMTEKEKEEIGDGRELAFEAVLNGASGYCPQTMSYNTFNIDYCNAHHLDYRGLIEMGLALEAPEDMYKID